VPLAAAEAQGGAGWDDGGVRRRLAAVCLVLETMVVFFAILVAKDLSDLTGGQLALLGGGLCLALLLLCGFLRYRSAYAVGSLLQVAIVASGLVVPVMWFVGAMFAVMWFGFLRLGTVVDRPVSRQDGEASRRPARPRAGTPVGRATVGRRPR